MLRDTGPLLWVHEEQKDILAMGFRFKDKESPRSYVVALAYSLQVY